jgi:hypothetical protein
MADPIDVTTFMDSERMVLVDGVIMPAAVYYRAQRSPPPRYPCAYCGRPYGHDTASCAGCGAPT